MKVLAFCACSLALASFSSAGTTGERLKQALSNEDSFDTCMSENNMTTLDFYTKSEIIDNEYAKPGNEEKRRQNGCTLECLLREEGLMVGSEIKEHKVHAEISRKMDGNPKEAKAHKIARDCIREVSGITQECEKGFSLFVCIVKATHKATKHDEHE
ncbi:PREDICTED: pheromone-binding protein Gp-9-like [Dinoponera quadriceps]|uniref:Pheromone-binding protein Gp-9 n=1 Tax=Dinoponera quadriceps TaxID=609295 RepID=A0A6P3Y2Q3_DINQU|nr:PREDICTED: pheromone-binding protein Gp-9-like [Dinoponera quadriceps]